MIGIYKIENKLNGKKYIGQSVNIKSRWSSHKSNKVSVISKAIAKYGVENFDFSVLEELDRSELNERESYWIEFYGSYGEYNMNRGGDCYVHTEGESNGRAMLTKEDVLLIRAMYRKKTDLTRQEIYEWLFKDKVGIRGFQKAWCGETWKSVDMSCYTPENILYYKTKAKSRPGGKNGYSNANDDIVTKIREDYVERMGREIFEDYGKDYFQSYSGFERALIGGTYSHLPVYKKRQKKWINK